MLPDNPPIAETVTGVRLIGHTTRLRARRHLERGSRHLVLVDIGIGLLAAAGTLWLAGLAIVAVVSLPLLAVCVVWFGVDRLRSRPRMSR
jgi:hypothetical protein